MEITLMILIMAGFFTLTIGWAVKILPKERWQIIASIPVWQDGENRWQGINLTWYGFFIACSYVLSTFVYSLLMASINIKMIHSFVILGLLVILVTIASQKVARIVEKKPHTSSIAGASFVGVVLAPFVVHGINKLFGWEVPILCSVSAMIISYAFGEGFGRIACISFGCCYGKPVSELSPFWQRLLGWSGIVFYGKTKKIAYESGLDGQRVIPVQAYTAFLDTTAGVLGTLLFLKDQMGKAVVVTICITQIWRFLSEFLRADFRGSSKITAYQKLSLLSMAYSLGLILLLPPYSGAPPELKLAFGLLWNPMSILFFEALWLSIFFYIGRSKVTGCVLEFYVHRSRI